MELTKSQKELFSILSATGEESPVDSSFIRKTGDLDRKQVLAIVSLDKIFSDYGLNDCSEMLSQYVDLHSMNVKIQKSTIEFKKFSSLYDILNKNSGLSFKKE